MEMGKTWGVWILYVIVLILKFLIVEKQKTASRIHGIVNWTAKLNQHGYFRAIFKKK